MDCSELEEYREKLDQEIGKYGVIEIKEIKGNPGGPSGSSSVNCMNFITPEAKNITRVEDLTQNITKKEAVLDLLKKGEKGDRIEVGYSCFFHPDGKVCYKAWAVWR